MKDRKDALAYAKGLLKPKTTLSSPDLTAAPAPVHIPFNRKNLGAVGLRKWVKVDKDGRTGIVQADKQALTHQLGVQVCHKVSVAEKAHHVVCNK